MAALAFGVAGATVGSMFGMTSLGWTLGAALGNQLFPQKTELPAVFGPRLGDLKVQTSTYGNMIPRVYGRFRLAGNVIWSTDILERPTTTTVSQGGKGGGGASEQTQTTYSYDVNMAVAICEGIILGIRKIWANGKLIYNVGEDTDIETNLASLTNFTVYQGTEDQMPDPTIEAWEGVGNVQAFRGTAYIVFNNFQLADYGNRPPNFEFEVIKLNAGEVQLDLLNKAIITDGRDYHPSEAVLQPNGLVWMSQQVGSFQPLVVALYDVASGQRLMEIGNVPGGVSWHDGQGNAVLLGPGVGLAYPDGHFETYAPRPNTPALPDLNYTHCKAYDIANSTIYYTFSQGFSAQVGQIILDKERLNYRHVPYGIQGGYGHQMVNGLQGTKLYVTSMTNTNPGGWGYFETTSGLYTSLDVQSNGFSSGIVGSDGYVYTGTWSSERDYIKKYDANTGALIAKVQVPGVNASHPVSSAWNSWVEDKQGFIWTLGNTVGDGGSPAILVKLDPRTMKVIDSRIWPYYINFPNGNPDYPGWMLEGADFAGKTPVFIKATDTPPAGQPYLWEFQFAVRRASAEQIDLADIVVDLCQQSSLRHPNDIDVTSLVGTFVDGYAVAQRMTIRASLEPLMQAYFFDAVESDFKVKFVKRVGTSLATIPIGDLCAVEGDFQPEVQPVEKIRGQETELPIEVNLAYVSLANNFQVAQQPAKRLISRSKHTITIQMPIALTDDHAREIAHAIQQTLWLERNSVTFQTWRKHNKYEPTDCLTIPIGNTLQKVRLTQKDEEPIGVVKLTAVFEEGTQYINPQPGASGKELNNGISLIGETQCWMLDVPMLRDVDNSPGFYVAMFGLSAGWIGGQLYRSIDGVTYDAVTNGLVLLPATVGNTASTLGNFASPELTEMFDEKNFVDVQLLTNEFISVTEGEAMAGKNLVMIGKEFLNFKTATLIGTKKYRLSGLLRGRLGTEQHISTHTSTERVVLIDDKLRTIPQTFNDLNVQRYYKAVSIGRTLPDTAPFVFTNTGVRLKPVSPWHLGAGRNAAGDIVFQWVRRTRYPAISWNLAVDPPLLETAERYAVDIYSGNVIVRTIESTEMSAIYTAAQQVADWGALKGPGTVSWQVSEISPEYGKGFTTSSVS